MLTSVAFNILLITLGKILTYSTFNRLAIQYSHADDIITHEDFTDIALLL